MVCIFALRLPGSVCVQSVALNRSAVSRKLLSSLGTCRRQPSAIDERKLVFNHHRVCQRRLRAALGSSDPTR